MLGWLFKSKDEKLTEQVIKTYNYTHTQDDPWEMAVVATRAIALIDEITVWHEDFPKHRAKAGLHFAVAHNMLKHDEKNPFFICNAIEHYKAALNLYNDGTCSRNLANTRLNLALAYEQSSKRHELKTKEKIVTLIQKANGYFEQNPIDNEDQFYRGCVNIIAVCKPLFKNKKDGVNFLQAGLDAIAQAEAMLANNSITFKNPRLFLSIAEFYLNHARYHHEFFKNAQEYAENALNLITETDMPIDFIECNMLLVRIYLSRLDGNTIENLHKAKLFINKTKPYTLKYNQEHSIRVLDVWTIELQRQLYLRGEKIDLSAIEKIAEKIIYDARLKRWENATFEALVALAQFLIKTGLDVNKVSLEEIVNIILHELDVAESEDFFYHLYYKLSGDVAEIFTYYRCDNYFLNIKEAKKILEKSTSFLDENGYNNELLQNKISLSKSLVILTNPSNPLTFETAVSLISETLQNPELSTIPINKIQLYLTFAEIFIGRPYGNIRENREQAINLIFESLELCQQYNFNQHYYQGLNLLTSLLVKDITLVNTSVTSDKNNASIYLSPSSIREKLLKASDESALQRNTHTWVALNRNHAMLMNTIGKNNFTAQIMQQKALLLVDQVLIKVTHSIAPKEIELTWLAKATIMLDIYSGNQIKVANILNELIEKEAFFNKIQRPLNYFMYLMCIAQIASESGQWQKSQSYYDMAMNEYHKHFINNQNKDFYTFIEFILGQSLSSMAVASIFCDNIEFGLKIDEYMRARELAEYFSKKQEHNTFDAIISNNRSTIHWILIPFSTAHLTRFILIPPKHISVQYIKSQEFPFGHRDITSFIKDDAPDGYSWLTAIDEIETQGANTLNQKISNFYNKYFSSVATWLDETTASFISKPHEFSLVILPYGILSILPCSALWLNNSEKFEKYNVSICPNISSLIALEQETMNKNYEIEQIHLISHDANNESEKLDYMLLEKELINHQFPVKDIFSLSNFHKKNSTQQNTILHIASHGYFLPRDHENSYIELPNNNKITLSDLNNEHTLNSRLVFLAACESGLSEYHERFTELTGFPSTFLQKGAAGIIATLWPISDEVTTLFTIKYYEILGTSVTYRKAMRLTQQWIRSSTNQEFLEWLDEKITNTISIKAQAELNNLKYRFSEPSPHIKPYNKPFFWAGYVYYGI